MGWRSILTFGFALLLFGEGNAPLDRSTLRGLKAVNIVVDPLDRDLEAAHITRDALLARVKRYLETAEIHVDPDAREFLGLRLMHVRDKRGPYAVCITLAMYQGVTLTRDPQIKTATRTWEVETVLISDPKQLEAATIETANELLESFVTAYRSVNPATGAAGSSPAR